MMTKLAQRSPARGTHTNRGEDNAAYDSQTYFSTYMEACCHEQVEIAYPQVVCSGGVINRKKPFRPKTTKISPIEMRATGTAIFIEPLFPNILATVR